MHLFAPATLALSLSLLLFVGCAKQNTAQDEPAANEEAQTAEAANSQPEADSKVETAAQEVVPATPEPNYFAPEGIYFLIGSVSIETADGVARVNPGARLELQADGSYKDAAGNLLKLRPDEVTNDLRIAQRVAGADAANQAAIRQQLAAGASSRRPPAAGTPKPPGSSTRPPPPGTGAIPANPAAADTLAATQGRSGGVQSSSTLGAGHTRVKNRIVWQKNADGEWVGIRYTNGKPIPPEDAPKER